MKKLSLIVLFILTLSLLCSCGLGIFDYSCEGIENFHPHLSDVCVCDVLIPENFLESYEYEDGNFFYECKDNYGSNMIDRALMYLTYNDTEYALAKEYVQSQLKLRDTGEVLNDYIIYVNTMYSYDYRTDHSYAFDYNMVALNDNNNTIVFFGVYSFVGKELLDESLTDHILEFYGHWYNFS